MFDFYFFSEHRKMKKENLCQILIFFFRKMKNENLWSIFFFFFFFWTQLTRKKRYNRLPCNCCHQLRSCSVECFCCNAGRLHYFFLRRGRTRSRKTSGKNAGDCGDGLKCLESDIRRLL